MILDIRYHIFTITAIFASLGLGILIGTSLIGDETLVREQQRMIKEIGQDINNLKTTNSKLKQNLSNLNQELEYKHKMEKKILSTYLEKNVNEGEYLIYAKTNLSEDIKQIFNSAEIKLVSKDDLVPDQVKGNKKLIYLGAESINGLPEKILKDFKNDIITCPDSDPLGLILTLLESVKVDKDN